LAYLRASEAGGGCRGDAVTCPACGTFEARIYRTMLGTHINRREQRCRCGIGWQLIERMDKGSVRHWATPGEIKGEMPLGARNGHAVKRAAETSGSLDSSERIQSGSDPNAQSSLLGKPRARKGKGRPSTQDYTPEFEAFWAALKIRSGNKKPAFDAWVKVPDEIRVDADRLIFTFNRWCETERWQDGKPLHVATWINQRGWENEPAPQLFRRVADAKPVSADPPWVTAAKDAEAKKRAERNAEMRARREIDDEIKAALAAGGVK